MPTKQTPPHISLVERLHRAGLDPDQPIEVRLFALDLLNKYIERVTETLHDQPTTAPASAPENATLSDLPTDLILEHVFPENQCLQKDSGLWSVYPGENWEEEPDYSQNATESFREFLLRAVGAYLFEEKDGMGMGLNLHLARMDYMAKFDNLT